MRVQEAPDEKTQQFIQKFVNKLEQAFVAALMEDFLDKSIKEMPLQMMRGTVGSMTAIILAVFSAKRLLEMVKEDQRASAEDVKNLFLDNFNLVYAQILDQNRDIK